MRRFSQRQHLVTLSEINITPLLDLAFVLLIIFIITTPMLEKGIDLTLPTGGTDDSPELQAENIWTVDITSKGVCVAKGREWAMNDIAKRLFTFHQTNENLIVYVRADEMTPFLFVAGFLNRMEQAGIDQISLRTKPTE